MIYLAVMLKDVLVEDVIISLKKDFNNLSHAYIFISPDNLYNLVYAKVFAGILFCENNNFCMKCPNCKKYLAETNTDFGQYPKGKSLLVQDIENIIEDCIKKPTLSEYKVYVINQIDEATVQAQNKLLKTLEEPPKNVIFLITASNENKIIPTIISRTRKIYLKCLTKDKVISFINEVNNIFNDFIPKKKYLPEEVIKASELSEGLPGKAVTLLNSSNFIKLIDLVDDICLKFSSSKEIITYSYKIAEFREEIFLLLNMLQQKFLQIMKEQQVYYVYCDIILKINESIEKIQNNNNLNLVIDNLLMKILEIKYMYKI